MSQHAFATTRFPTPVFNTPVISSCFGGKNGDELSLDDQGLMRSVETILFAGTSIELLQKMQQPYVWKIQTREYPYPNDLFIDERFIEKINFDYKREIKLPSMALILKTMQELEKTRYIWGGNWPHGIDPLPNIYPSKSHFHQLHPLIQDIWSLRGVDCSGLLYYATNGWTPRNTSSLIEFGKSVDIEGKSILSILQKVQPLDLIVWRGHVVCIIDQHTTIESKSPEGVVKLNAYDRLYEIIQERTPSNHIDPGGQPTFVIRRWHPDAIV